MTDTEPLDLDAWKRPSIAELFGLLTRAHLGGGKPADRWARMAVSVQKLVDSREAALIAEVRRLREGIVEAVTECNPSSSYSKADIAEILTDAMGGAA